MQLAELALAADEAQAEMWLVKGESLTALGQYAQAIESFISVSFKYCPQAPAQD